MTARVLYMEDEPHLVRAVRRVLPTHWVMDSADTLDRGLSALKDRRYDVVLLDLGLPDCGGRQSYDRLREVWSGPVVILTGYVDAKIATMLLLDGAHDVLEKGNLTALPFALRRAVRQGRLEIPTAESVASFRAINWTGLALKDSK